MEGCWLHINMLKLFNFYSVWRGIGKNQTVFTFNLYPFMRNNQIVQLHVNR